MRLLVRPTRRTLCTNLLVLLFALFLLVAFLVIAIFLVDDLLGPQLHTTTSIFSLVLLVGFVVVDLALILLQLLMCLTPLGSTVQHKAWRSRFPLPPASVAQSANVITPAVDVDSELQAGSEDDNDEGSRETDTESSTNNEEDEASDIQDSDPVDPEDSTAGPALDLDTPLPPLPDEPFVTPVPVPDITGGVAVGAYAIDVSSPPKEEEGTEEETEEEVEEEVDEDTD